MLHADNQIAAFFLLTFGDRLKYIRVVDLTSSRFFASGIVASLKVTNLVPSAVDVGDQVSFADLLVVDVKQYLATWRINGSADCVSLIGIAQERAAMIGVSVQRL